MKLMLFFGNFFALGISLLAMELPHVSDSRISELYRSILEDQGKLSSITMEDARRIKKHLHVYERQPRENFNLSDEIFEEQSEILLFKLFIAQQGYTLNSESSVDEIFKCYTHYYGRKILDNQLSLDMMLHLHLSNQLSNSIDETLDKIKLIAKNRSFNLMMKISLFIDHLLVNRSIDCLKGLTKQEIEIAIKRKDADWEALLEKEFDLFCDAQNNYLRTLEGKMFERRFDSTFRNYVGTQWQKLDSDIVINLE